MVYVNPKMGMCGLGNMLFTWARAQAFCWDVGGKMISPTWTKLHRIGPWLRGERDKRYYLREMTNTGYVGGMKKFFLLKGLSHITENEYWDEGAPGVCVVDFIGMKDFFLPFLSKQKELKEKLLSIVHPNLVRQYQEFGNAPFIAIHIRRGDFISAGLGIPNEWYVNALGYALRETNGVGIKRICVFSDAVPEELDFIRAAAEGVPVQIMPRSPAILDILRMSKACVFIGTKDSTFGFWSVFLGQMPSIWTVDPRGYHPRMYIGNVDVKNLNRETFISRPIHAEN